MNRHLICFLIVFLLFPGGVYAAGAPAGNGILLPATRVIYPENAAGGVSFTVTNNTDNLYLLQSRVISAGEEDADGGKVPFIVIPPLTRFEPGASVTLLIRQSGKIPQTNRELLWRLALKTIPAQQDNTGGAAQTSLILALQNNLKLFYRPSVLPAMTAEERAGKLTFAAENGMLTVTNPTPYHVTFGELLADGRRVDTGNDNTIVPYSTVRYPAGHRSPSQVRWSVTGDRGAATEVHERSLR